MIKSILLASSMIIAAPVFAQDAPKPTESQPVQDVAANPAPVTDATQDQPAPAETAAAATPAAQPASTQEQVAQAVGRDFGTYDKDADGTLNATEFASWVGTLRKAAEPSFEPGSPEAMSWADQAFNSADADKSASVNKQELTVFLTPKPS